MKLFLLILTVFIFTRVSLSQDIQKLSSVSQLDSIKSVSKGYVTLVNFWATWCKPCVQEFPELIRLYNDYKNNQFRIIFVSLDAPGEINTKVKPFLAENQVDFTTYFSDFVNSDDLMNYFDSNWDGAIPTTFIYDKNGNLKSGYIGSHDYNFFQTEIVRYLN